VVPMQTGALLAGANPDELATIQKLGKALGTAYQLTDDNLGMFGDESVTGKSALGDIREGKRHYLYQYTRSHLAGDELQFFETNYGNGGITTEDAGRIRELVISSGALAQSENLITNLADTATGLVEALSIGPGYKIQIHKLISRATKRVN